MSTTPRTEWKLTELAAEVGVSPRTVRYYVQRGLLPAPPFKGPDTVYGEEHLVRLKAIRVLQARSLPLEAIQDELRTLSFQEIKTLSQVDPSTASFRPPPHRWVDPLREFRPVLPSTRVTSWRRWELAPGLELHLADSADDTTRALAEHLRALTLKP